MAKIIALKSFVSEKAAASGKSYKICEFSYRNEDGKVKSQRVLDFVQPEIFKLVQAAESGDVFESTMAQNEKGYWQFKTLAFVGKADPEEQTKGEPMASGKKSGDWETSVERARKQEYIVRQSTAALAKDILCHNNPKGVVTIDEVLGMAQVLEQWVFRPTAAPTVKVTGDVE